MNPKQKLQKRRLLPDFFCTNCIIVFIIYILIFIALILSSSFGIGFMPSFMAKPREWFYFVIQWIEQIQGLPLIIIFLPIIGGPIEAYLGKKSEMIRDTLVVNSTFITFLLILLMYPKVMKGEMVYHIPHVLGYGLTFRVDILSYIMAVTAGVVWFFVTIYAHDYMGIEKHRDRFYLWMSVTFGGILGTVLAGDLFTLFLFFELMTFSSYLLVAHNQSKESLLAGNSYIFMGMVGGLSILLGMILLYMYTGTLEFIPLASSLAEIGWRKYMITLFFVIGFGIKAGMLPLHIWLPRAHPVAPTPASALLSGILIKVGAYGILRLAISIFMPDMSEITGFYDPLWIVSKNLGFILIWMGIITMTIGVFHALQQNHMKKMLAYHSISQMGYIIMGIGVEAYLGYKGGMGYAASIYHIVNHALFKSLLFMVVGLIYLRTKEMDMYKLGGLWKKMPFTALVCLIAAFGITGMPGFNGFISKSLLHHAIVEAYEYGHYSFRYAEMLFTLVSAGTVCSFLKLYGFVFLGKCPDRFLHIEGDKGMMDLAMGGLALLIVLIGHVPNFMMDHFIIPSAQRLTFEPAFIDRYLVGIQFFNWADIRIMIAIYILGGIIFLLGMRFHLFHLHFYEKLDIQRNLYQPIYDGIIACSKGICTRYEKKILSSDVIIYATVLTIILFVLLRFV